MDYISLPEKKLIFRQFVKKFHIYSEIKISYSNQEKLAIGYKFTQLNPVTSYFHAVPPEVLSPLSFCRCRLHVLLSFSRSNDKYKLKSSSLYLQLIRSLPYYFVFLTYICSPILRHGNILLGCNNVQCGTYVPTIQRSFRHPSSV